MKCLNCNAEMTNYLVKKMFDEMSYDICHSCGSLWLDNGELDKMAFQVQGSIEYCSKDKMDKQEKDKECPRCEKVYLVKVKFVGLEEIILDRCDNCGGFFLDGKELELINKDLKEMGDVYGKGFSEFINDIHFPFWQKKIKRKSSETDFLMMVKPIKNSKLLSEAGIKCPWCNLNLDIYEFEDIKYEGCPECRGMFLNDDELRILKDKSEEDSWGNLRWMDDEIEAIKNATLIRSTLDCPKCKSHRMISTIFGISRTIIDYCTKCKGIWLDYKEYYEIIEHLKDKLDKFSTAEMRGKLAKEYLEIESGPESRRSELLDYKAATKAFEMICIYEDPEVASKLLDFTINLNKHLPL